MDVNLGLDQDLINAVAAITEASCSAKKMEKEELHPNQKVLDKNKNGKLDADDFKRLRKEETVEESMDEEDFNLEDYSLEELKDFMASRSYTKSGESLYRKAIDNTHDKIEAIKKKIDPEYPKSANPAQRGRKVDKALDKLRSGKLTNDQMDEIESLAIKHGLGE